MKRRKPKSILVLGRGLFFGLVLVEDGMESGSLESAACGASEGLDGDEQDR